MSAHIQPIRQAVLVVDVERRIGNYAYHRQPAALAQDVEPRVENRLVAAELVDHQTLAQGLFIVVEQHERAEQLREHAPAVDVAHEQHRRRRHLGHAHVHDVVVFQVNLGRAAGALQDDDVEAACQVVIGAHDVGDELVLVGEVLASAHGLASLAVHDDLAARVAGRLQQNGVHGHLGWNARRLGLHHLGTTHLITRRRDGRVQRHVLRLERGHPQAILGKHPTKPRYEQALARIRHRSLHHDRFRCHWHTSLNAANKAAFSSAVRTAMRYQLLSSPS